MAGLPGIGVITLDSELRIRSWNEWLVAATGVPELVAVGRPVTDFAPAARADMIGAELADVRGSGITRVLAPSFHHYLVLCPPPYPNEYFQAMQQRVTLAPLRDETRVVGVMVTVEDVTARMIEEREHAKRAAEGMQEATDLVAQAVVGDWQLRAAATKSLRQSASEDDIAQLLEALERDHHNFSVLSGALQVLVGVHRDVTAPLMGLLRNPSANVRIHAALALGALGDRGVVPALLRALDDADTNVRFHAIEALGRLAAPEAVAGLQRVAESGDFFLAFPAIDALARIDDAGVVPALMALLDHDDLRPAVVDALAALGDEDCVGILTGLLNDGRGDVASVSDALVRIARRYEETFAAGAFIADAARSALSPSGVAHLIAATADAATVQGSVITVLGWAGTVGLHALVSAIGNERVRSEVTEALLGIGPAAVPLLASELMSGTPSARVAAAFLIGAIGDPAGGQALVSALASHDNELVLTVLRAIAALGVRDAVESLYALFAHPDVMVRQAAIAAVNSLGADLSRSRLASLLDDADPRIRECAIRVVGYFGYEGCADDLVRAVSDESEDVRRAAIEQLPLQDDPRSVNALLIALTRETPRNRGAAAHALRLSDDARCDEALIDALGDEHAWVRYFAAASLAHRRAVAAVDTLEAMARVDAAPHVRIAAIRALAVLDVSSLLRVIPTAVDDQDEEVAAAAIQALSAGGGRAAEQVLERAIQSSSTGQCLAAAEALGSLGTHAAVQALAWAARLTEPQALSATAIESLRRIGGTGADNSPAAVSALLQLGTEASRRERVVRALNTLSPAAIPMVSTETLPSAAVRAIAVEALARMRNATATERVAAVLADPDARLRAIAVNAFGRLGSSSVSDTIAAMSATDPDASVRRRAMAVCRRYGWIADARSAGAR